MAKGKHAPNKGALKQAEKVLHPGSRKVGRIAKKATHRVNIDIKGKVGLNRLTMLAEKLSWLREALPGVEDEDGKVTCAGVLQLVEGFLARFDDEVEQIKLRQSIGGNQKNRRQQHSARMDAIELTSKTELSDFQGCGLELPDFFDLKNLEYFKQWEGEVRFVQNIKLKQFRKADLEAGLFDAPQPESMDT